MRLWRAEDVFHRRVQDEVGYALYLGAAGEKHLSAKPLKGVGPGRFGGRLGSSAGTRSGRSTPCAWPSRVYVLHAFQKKVEARDSRRTPQVRDRPDSGGVSSWAETISGTAGVRTMAKKGIRSLAAAKRLPFADLGHPRAGRSAWPKARGWARKIGAIIERRGLTQAAAAAVARSRPAEKISATDSRSACWVLSRVGLFGFLVPAREATFEDRRENLGREQLVGGASDGLP